MLEQNKALNLSDVLQMFRPANLETPRDLGNQTGFQDMLDKALQAQPREVKAEVLPRDNQPGQTNTQGPEVQPEEVRLATNQGSKDPVKPLQNQGGQDQQAQAQAQHAILQTTKPSTTVREGRVKHAPTSDQVEQGSSRTKQRSLGSQGQKPGVETKEPLDKAQVREDIPTRAKKTGSAIEDALAAIQQIREASTAKGVLTEIPLQKKTKDSLGDAKELGPPGKKSKTKDANLGLANSANSVDTLAQGNQNVQVSNKKSTNTQATGVATNGREGQDHQALTQLNQTKVQGENKLVSDALKLVKELSGKLGLGGTDKKSTQTAQEPGQTQERGPRKITRSEMLRKERLDVQGQHLRVETGPNVKAAPSVDPNYKLVSMPGLQSIRVDEVAAPKDWVPYNPTTAQSVIHHTITLPTGTTPSIANFSGLLRSQLRDGLNADLVGQAKILLQGADKGEIKLILHPESLGEVRIHLKMEDSAIGGTIYVENKEVLEVFKDNLADLKQAFADGGLDASLLNLSLGGNEAGSGGDFARSQQDGAQFAREATRVLDESVPVLRFQDSENSLVDVVV